MKLKSGLIIILMVIISLLAIGVASASENVSDFIETADFEEVVSIEDNLEDAVAIEGASESTVTIENNTDNSEILSLESENEPNAVNVEENEIIEDIPSLGMPIISNSTLIIDLSEKSASEGSFLSAPSSNFDIDSNNDTLTLIDLTGIYENNTLFGINLTSLINGNFTDLSSLLDDLDWNLLISNSSNLTSLLNNLNWTDLFEGNLTSLADSLNLTNILGFNISDITSLLDLNLTNILDNLNLTNITGFNISDITSLLDLNLTNILDKINLTSLPDLNLTKIIDELNLTSLINNFNWTSIIGGDSTDTSADKDKNTGFDWKSIFRGKDSGTDSIINNIINWITGNDEQNNTSTEPKSTHIVVDKKFSRVANDYSAGERGGNHTGYLLDQDGKPVANRTVQIAVNGPIYNVTTDENGAFNLQINLAAANTYTYAISFQGDDKYKASPLASSKLIMTKKSTSITASAKTFKSTAKTKTISVTLKTIKNPYDGKTYLKAGKKLTLKVNGKTYTAKTNSKGVAKFTIKLTKKGKYTAAIKFAGDKTYKASNKKIKVTIK